MYYHRDRRWQYYTYEISLLFQILMPPCRSGRAQRVYLASPRNCAATPEINRIGIAISWTPIVRTPGYVSEFHAHGRGDGLAEGDRLAIGERGQEGDRAARGRPAAARMIPLSTSLASLMANGVAHWESTVGSDPRDVA